MTRLPGYNAAHRRLDRHQGPARHHPCSWCGRTAKDWALIHSATDTLTDPRDRVYSLNPADYQPMCDHCHKRYDSIQREWGCEQWEYRFRLAMAEQHAQVSTEQRENDRRCREAARAAYDRFHSRNVHIGRIHR